MPAPLGSPPDRVDRPTRRLQKRLGDIVETIQAFAELRFDLRAPIGPDGDIVDAVAAGVNFLGEELDASFREIERRVTDRTAQLKDATEELANRALHDELTGLPNRTLFWEQLAHRLALSDRRRTSFAVLFLDVDRFKLVNDTLGHATGDRLLVDLASCLAAVLRKGDIAARMGGDEFAVLLDETVAPDAALAVAERLRTALMTPLMTPHDPEAKERTTSTSIGVALGPAGFSTADEVVAAADLAMYSAKRGGGGRCVLYSEDLAMRRAREEGDRLDATFATADAAQLPQARS